jgi:hypothetical protein
MTRENDELTVERRVVVVFDICSSTTILEDLKQTDNLAKWRNLLISLKQCLLHEGGKLGLEPYKFIGDGWILLFPDTVSKDELCNFLRVLSTWFDEEFGKCISKFLTHEPSPIGLMFGIDSGELIRLEMNEQWEFLGRPINVASRLQGQTKELPGGPSYKALFSKNSFNSPPQPGGNIKVEPVTVALRNISHGEKYECLVFQAYENLQRKWHAAPDKSSPLIKHGLEIVFGGDHKPYFEEEPNCMMPGGLLLYRRYRVGIRNTSGKVISKARVVLENCEPNESHGVHLDQPLHLMGDAPGTTEFSIQPGDGPSRFVDVVYDEILGGRLRDDAFGLCYAAQLKSFAIRRGSYVLTVRVEGDGMQSRKKFKIYQESSTQMLTMRELVT